VKHKRKEILLLIDAFDLELMATYIKGRVKYFNPPLSKKEIIKRMKKRGA